MQKKRKDAELQKSFVAEFEKEEHAKVVELTKQLYIESLELMLQAVRLNDIETAKTVIKIAKFDFGETSQSQQNGGSQSSLANIVAMRRKVVNE